MGNYSNQPDYATSASNHTPDTVNFTTFLDQSAIYVSAGTEVSVIIAGQVPSFENVVRFKGIKGGTFMPVVVDYILGAAVASAATYIATGTTFTGSSVSGSVEGTYFVDCPIALTAAPNTANGAIKLKVVVNGSATITSIEAIEPSRNPATLGGTAGSVTATHQFTIPANSLGGTHAAVASGNLSSSKITALGFAVAANTTSMVIFK